MTRRLRRFNRTGMVVITVALGLPAVADVANSWWKKSGDCLVWGIIDGDTFAISCPGIESRRLRLEAVDTPEYAGACWSERWAAIRARLFVQGQLFAAPSIEVMHDGRLGRYGRLLGDLQLGEASLSQRLLDSGHGRTYVPGIDWCNGEAA